MILGRIKQINKNKKTFSVKIEEDEFAIIEYYDENDISLNDLLLAGNIPGDVFIKNETTDKFFQGKIIYPVLSEKKMKKIMG